MFGDRLKDLRKNKGLTQTDIANMFNVTDATVSAWETNKATPGAKIMVELAKYFNVSIDYLYGFNQEDLDNIERLKTVFKEAGMWNEEMNDITLEDLNKALKIVSMMKENKDTDKK